MLLNPMKGKIQTVHHPGLTHSNVDPLSRHPSQHTYHASHDGTAFSFVTPTLL